MINHKVEAYKIINNPKGNIYKVASHDKFPDFLKGDIYFSEVDSNTIKGWMRHLKLKAIFGVVVGELTMKIRSSDNNIISHKISLESSNLIAVEPETWYGFQNNSNQKSLIFVILNGVHDKNEIERMEIAQSEWLK